MPGGTLNPPQIKGGETKLFSVNLEPGQYAAFRVEQHGSILLVTLFDPQNKPVSQMDNPAGGHGPILFSTVATLPGSYRVEVTSKDKWANPAKFEIAVDPLKVPTPDHQRTVEAQQAFAEGRKHLGNRNTNAALVSFKSSMNIWLAAKNLRWQALTHFALAQTYAAIGARERPNAIKELEAALRILKEQVAPNDWRLMASALNDLGSHYTYTGEVQRGIDLLNQARALYSQHNDRRGHASSLNNLSIAHGRFLGNYSLALDLVEKAVPLRYAENDRPGATNLMNSLGGIADLLGEPEKAMAYFSKAQQEWEKLPEIPPADPRRVTTLLNLATINDKLGHWEQARDLYDKVLAIFSEGDSGRIDTLVNKGELYASFGDVKRARECYEDALRRLPAKEFDPDQKARILVQLGQLFLIEEKLPDAVSKFEEARALKLEARRLADVLTNLGTGLTLQGESELAVKAYQEALEIQEESKDVRGQALTLQKRGEAYNLLKKPEAIADLKRAVELWKSVKDVRGLTATLNALARAEQNRGNLLDALAYSDEAIKTVESQRMTLSSREFRTSYFATQENYFELNIDLNMQLNRANGDTRHLAQAFEANEKSRARTLLEALKEAHVDRGDEDRNTDKDVAALLEQRVTLTKQLAAKAAARTKLLIANPKAVQLAAFDKEIDSLSEKCDALDAAIRSRNLRFATLTRPQPASLKEIQQQLDDETLLLEVSLGDKRSYAWIVTPNTIDGFELPGRDEIESAANRMGEAITALNLRVENELGTQRRERLRKANADYADAARSLSNMLLEQLAPKLDRKRMLVIADGALQNVSFASLPAPKKLANAELADARLIDTHEIIVLPSASVVGVIRQQVASRKEASQPLIVFANPVFAADDSRVASSRSSGSRQKSPGVTNDQSSAAPAPMSDQSTGRGAAMDALRSNGIGEIAPLPFSAAEAQGILKATNGQGVAKLDFNATRALALSPEMSRYRVIHFATHGVVDLERPALSRIILSLVDKEGRSQDGFLFLHDIYNLNLPAELVVLSACQTGVGKQVKGEGLIALTRGFMYAGAARLVASYWDVDDKATADLMEQFYIEMFTNKKRPAEALQLAQLHLRKQRRYSSPNFWAGFFIQGEWK
ncbi:MAG TPA: CHAT domain-containing protein [Pyrinomonadaceae bacterium]|nr:CHAT domain-containing protein [Pyrinomonadaceae bacterium]